MYLSLLCKLWLISLKQGLCNQNLYSELFRCFHLALTSPSRMQKFWKLYCPFSMKTTSPYYTDVVEHGHFPSLVQELENWITRWRDFHAQNLELPKHVLQCLNSLNMSLYPNIKVVFLLFLTLPVTTASMERAFSEMRLLKTWLRSTISDPCLSSLALMHFKRQFTGGASKKGGQRSQRGPRSGWEWRRGPIKILRSPTPS